MPFQASRSQCSLQRILYIQFHTRSVSPCKHTRVRFCCIFSRLLQHNICCFFFCLIVPTLKHLRFLFIHSFIHLITANPSSCSCVTSSVNQFIVGLKIVFAVIHKFVNISLILLKVFNFFPRDYYF